MRLLVGGTGSPVPTDELVPLYAYPDPVPARGWVRASMVSTLDGAAAGADGVSGSVSSPADRTVFSTLRGLADVILVGAGTVTAERYSDPERRPRFDAVRSGLGQSPVPAMAVVTASGGVPDRLLRAPGRLEDRWRLVVLTCESAPAERLRVLRAALGDDAVVVGPGGSVDPRAAVEAVVARGMPRVLCEGGPTLLAQVVEAGCLDELCLTTSPRLVGGAAGRVLAGAATDRPATLAHLLEQDGTLMARWMLGRTRAEAP